MRILITGATGFIGSILVPYLSELLPCCTILTLNRDKVKATKKFSNYHNVIIRDSEDWKSVEDFNPQIVIHLAALNTANEDLSTVTKLIESNIIYGVKLLNSLSHCNDFNLFINTGSFAEYMNGDDTIDCAYFYAATKVAFEVFLDYFKDKYHFRAITAILYSVYGGDMTVKRVMDYIYESLNSPEPVEMTEGKQILDFIHVKDVVDFYYKLITNIDKLPTDISHVKIGTGVGTQIRDIAFMLEKMTDCKCNVKWGARSYRDRDIMFAVAPPSKLLEWIGWAPEITLQQGLADRYKKNEK